jgi:hypothetical protein
MKPQDRTFQLENFVPGIFLAQGLAGGMLAGFGFMFATTLWTNRPDFIPFLVATPLVMIAGGTAGVIQATVIWALYRFIGIQMPVSVRIVLTVITIRLVTMFFGLRWGLDDQSPFIIGVGIALMMGLPIALLVGSAVKPWQLFTFGRIAIGSAEFERQAGSRSVPGTLGALPLRFLSLFALASWLLFVSCQRDMGASPTECAAALVIPASYPALSAYLTFRSPHKSVLAWIALVVNFPIALIALFPSENYKASWFAGVILHSSEIGVAFLIAWLIFLIARLAAPTENPVLTLDDALRHTCDGRLVSPGRYK